MIQCLIKTHKKQLFSDKNYYIRGAYGLGVLFIIYIRELEKKGLQINKKGKRNQNLSIQFFKHAINSKKVNEL